MSIRSILLFVLLFSLSIPVLSQNSSTAKKKTGKHSSSAASKKSRRSTRSKKARLSPEAIRRMQRMNRAFVASNSLKPMAKQLLEMRNPPAYAGVQAFATRHAGTDEGAMANLVLAYAHILDHEYPQAQPYLKKAQSKSGELGDYVTYFTALAQNGQATTGDQVTATLKDFQQKFPDSIFARDAAVIYVSALLANGQAEEAIATGKEFRNPPRSDLELAIGRAYLKAGDVPNATEALRRVYFAMPMSDEASAAGADLASINGMNASFAERKARADLLAQGKRYRDAVREYTDILNLAPSTEQHDAIQVAMAIADYRAGSTRSAKQTLESMQVSGDANARRLAFLADIARDDHDENRLADLMNQLRQAGPTSPYLEQSLLAAGNMYLLKKDYDHAIDFYRELDQRFPTGRLGHYAHWKSAWLSLRQGRSEDARQGFEDQISKYPDSIEVPPALYWRGRLAEDAHNVPMARAYYRKVIERFPNYYYADRSRERLALIGTGAIATEALLDHVPPVTMPKAKFGDVPEDNLRAQKARLLENCAMFDYAVKELQKVPSGDTDWTAGEIARIYQESGGYYRALNYLKRTVPTYFSLDYSALPRNYWETLFPRPFWTDLKRYSAANSLDPYLVASLIRQESEFNPGAISHANALGLMQVLPGTGKKLAKEVKMKGFRAEKLLVPTTNIQLGTRYFKDLLDQFNGHPEYALAAYNAGSDRVQAWLSDGNFRDPQEFVESIPFTETREYVQAIMRNATVYKKLYPANE